ncbi:hypothetical protein CWI37_0196p0040 [Hamiltosporidium tvaerminnensis]|uniref:Uncharacterized protein n=1 Tax=Hamiltosporidium tvaerminnensis TaxID=1176355 RepID=A0A4Q9L8T4_9MICR|nr:hypothetical protein LUQ84_003280 [Hamiltosporidium tvaerminnensis]TBU04014.1 hypothetical protein CWI37_0196p0040 [Hamiltosporidium tvaerminnensis]
MVVITFNNILFNHLFGYLNVVWQSELDTSFYLEPNNSAFTGNDGIENYYYQASNYLNQAYSEINPSLCSPSSSLSNRVQTNYLSPYTQENPTNTVAYTAFNDQPNPQTVSSHLYSSDISSQNILPVEKLPRFDLAFCHSKESNQKALYNRDVPNFAPILQNNVLSHQEEYFLPTEQYQIPHENSNNLDSENNVYDSEITNALSSLINFHETFDYKSTISNTEFFNRITNNIDACESLEATYNSQSHKEGLNIRLLKRKKFVATAENTVLLSSREEGYKIKMTCEVHHDNTRKLSMTRCKLLDIILSRQLKSIQEGYNSILKSFIKLKKFERDDKKNDINEIILKNIHELNLDKVFLDNLHAQSYKDLISSNIKHIFYCIFLKNKTFIRETKSHPQHLTYTVQELEQIFSSEIANLKSQDNDASNVLKICSFFVDYEKKLLRDMSISMILEALKLPKISGIFIKFYECLKIDVFYEILVFIERHEKNVEQIIKKNHVVSTIFLLNALAIDLDKKKSISSQGKIWENLHLTSRVRIYADTFYRGQLFESLLRNLEEYETKANCYGMLNTCRFLLNVVTFGKCRKTLLFLQIPCLIAMILNKSFKLDNRQIKEFFAFILLLIKKKKTINSQEKFYNDMIQYFFETNSSIIDHLVRFNIFLIEKYTNAGRKKHLGCIFISKCKNVFESLGALSQNIPQKDLKLKQLYASQLYWIMIFGNRSSIYSNNFRNITNLATNLERKINELI